ncbi:hypothetical protein H4696_008461 [Amycolatopsis lexingtonensis]|uniref:Uncharacterized protein n=1 Tax=Amycolatopsis lexingtonensis TaxID=218822 RepID=A0ABR9IDU2_9PSEU|nr:hypothetical protein [Amycolatopsis lexingtonensis]MBE1501361.1 hypothetical protein [Amycolatopsis lexingtonensis]
MTDWIDRLAGELDPLPPRPTEADVLGPLTVMNLIRRAKGERELTPDEAMADAVRFWERLCADPEVRERHDAWLADLIAKARAASEADEAAMRRGNV